MHDSADQPARRAELLIWESSAWALTGTSWILAAWPGLIVDWDGLTFAPLIGLGVLATLATWQILRGGAGLNPSSWITPRTWTSNRHPPKHRRALKRSVALDGILWAGSGVAWCAAARRFDWSETLTGARFQVGVGTALTVWAILGLFAATRLQRSGGNAIVVRRRVLGTGPMTVHRGGNQPGQQITGFVSSGNATR